MRRQKSQGSVRQFSAKKQSCMPANSIVSRILSELSQIKEAPDLPRVPNSDHVEKLSTLSIHELCTLCTKASKTYNLTDRERALQILQILLSIEDVLAYLSLPKLHHIQSKLQILNKSPVIAKLISKVNDLIASKKRYASAKRQLGTKTKPAVCWDEEYEGSVAFSSQDAYRSYRKSRDLIANCFTQAASSITSPTQSVNPTANIRTAIHLASTAGNLIKLSRFIVLSLKNSPEVDDGFTIALVQEARATAFDQYLVSWVYHFLGDSTFNASPICNKENISPKRSRVLSPNVSPSSKLEGLRIADSTPTSSPDSSSKPTVLNVHSLLGQIRLAGVLAELLYGVSKSRSNECTNWKYKSDADITELSGNFEQNYRTSVDSLFLMKCLRDQDSKFCVPWVSAIVSHISPFLLARHGDLRKIVATVVHASAKDPFLSLITQELPRIIENPEKLYIPLQPSRYLYDEHDFQRYNLLEKCSRYWNAYSLSVLDLFTKNYAAALASGSQVSPVYRSPTKSAGSLVVKARKVSLTPTTPPTSSAARRISLTQKPDGASPTSDLKSISMSKFKLSPPSSATPFSSDNAIEAAFLKGISSSVERAITLVAERTYSNTIRTYRMSFQSAKDSDGEDGKLVLAESVKFVEPVYKKGASEALPPLLPIDWPNDRKTLAICICQKRAAARVNQWLLDRRTRLTSLLIEAEDQNSASLEPIYYDGVSARHQLGQELLDSKSILLRADILSRSNQNGISWSDGELLEIEKLKSLTITEIPQLL